MTPDEQDGSQAVPAGDGDDVGSADREAERPAGDGARPAEAGTHLAGAGDAARPLGRDGGRPIGPSAEAPRGLFVGLTTMDVLHRATGRPGPNEKVTATRQDVAAGGPAANAAVTFAALGGRARLLSALGTTGPALVARDDLARHGVAIVDAAEPDHPLAVSAILVEEETGERSVISADAALAHVVAPTELPLGDVDVVLLDGHHPALARAVLRALDVTDAPGPCIGRREPRASGAAGRSGGGRDETRVGGDVARCGDAGRGRAGVSVSAAEAPEHARPAVVLDCGRWRPVFAELLPVADVAALSADFRLPGVDGGGEETARAVIAAGARAVVVTDGGGPVRWWAGGASGNVPVERVTVRDTLGAGDAFHGALAAALARGANVPEAVALAARVATLRVTSVGPRAWLAQVERWWPETPTL